LMVLVFLLLESPLSGISLIFTYGSLPHTPDVSILELGDFNAEENKPRCI
jgi:hypothetical protein